MKTTLLVLFLLLFTISIKPQLVEEWASRFSGVGYVASLATDSLGNVYIAGTDSTARLITKFNSAGIQQWSYSYANTIVTKAIALDREGNIFVIGTGGSSDFFTIKYDSLGLEQWVRTYNGPADYLDEPKALVIDSDGNVYVTGDSYGQNSSLGLDYLTIKYSSTGNTEWVERYDGPAGYNDYTTGLVVDNDDNVYVSGTSQDEEFWSGRIRTIKYNSSGVQQWVQTYTNGIAEQTTAIGIDNLGNIIVTGSSFAYTTGRDYVTIKYNSSGVQQWVQRYNYSQIPYFANHDDPNSLVVDSEGSVYVTGFSGEEVQVENWGITTVKYSSGGIQQWVNKIANINSYHSYPLAAIDDSSNIYLSFYNYNYEDILDRSVMKYNSAGEIQWEVTESERFSKILIDDFYNLYTLNDSTNTIIKYIQIQDTLPKQPPTNLVYDFTTHTLKWSKSPSTSVLNHLIIKQEFNPWTNTAGPWVSVADSGGRVNKNDSVWTIQTNGFYNFKVGAVFGTDTLFSDSIFVELGYFLRKIEDNKVIAYNSETDLFKLIRNLDNWPASWYNQFNYNNPFSYSPGFLFIGTPNQTYCDWPLFTEIIGNDQAYINEPLNISNLISVYAWKVRSGPIYKGSCAGFSISSILNFYQDQNYLQQFPYMVNKTPGLIPNTDSEARKVINHLQKTQTFPYPTMLKYEPSDPNNSNANYVLNRLIEIFSNYNNTRLDQFISLTSNDSGLHAVVPFAIRIVSGRPNRYDIQVYDSNDPENIYGVQIHTDKNTWSYIGVLVDSSASGIALRGSITSRLGLLTWKEPENGGGSNGPLNVNATERIIYISDSSSVAISINDEVIAGYNISNNSIVSFENSIIEATDGAFNPPKGFIVPNVESKVIFSDQIPGSKASMMFQSDSKNYYVAERTSNALNGEVETIEIINEGFNYLNTDNINKTINLTTMSETYQNNKFAQLSNIIIDQNDSLGFWFQNDSLNLKNTGGSKNYKITLINADPSGKSEFINDPVSIAANSTHILSPDWADLENDVLLVLIDTNNDGIIDDSLLLPNQFDPLPVELNSFTAKRLHNSVRLDWLTATEVNNYGFEIERCALSAERQAWNKIGFVEGSGNSNSPKNYSYLDKSISIGVYAYRLKQIDNDGTFSYSNEIEIDLSNLAISYSLNQNYPNPFNPVTQIDFSLAQPGFVTLNIYNSIGQLIRTLVNEKLEPGSYNYEWNATDNYGNTLASGIYFYKLQAGSFVETKKMILIR